MPICERLSQPFLAIKRFCLRSRNERALARARNQEVENATCERKKGSGIIGQPPAGMDGWDIRHEAEGNEDGHLES